MLLPNPEIDPTALAKLVAECYGANPDGLVFVPVGGDGWHYRCPPFWVSVRRDRQGHSPLAYQAARELSEAGHEYILAPIANGEGRLVHQLGRFPVVVLPLVEGATLFESGVRPGEVDVISQLCQRLHDAACTAPLPRETYTFPFADELRDSLEAATRAGPHCGPFGEALQARIERNRGAIHGMVAEANRLAAACRADPDTLVLTHGEPNPGNVLRDRAGRLYLIDWGDLMYGPPERDWAMLGGMGLTLPIREEFARFYQLRWILGEIAEYTARFSAPHSGNAEDEDRWRELLQYLH
jgi:spectinomycin phosphotransferase